MEAAMTAQLQQMTQQAMLQQAAGVQGGALTGTPQNAQGEQAGVNGAFAALLQQMLGQGGETAILNGGAQQKALLLEQMRKQLGQEGADMGMQLLAQMLAVNPSIVQQMDTSALAELAGQVGQTGQATNAITGAAQNAAPTTNAANAANTAQAVMLQNMLLANGGVTQPAQTTDAFAAQLATLEQGTAGRSLVEQVLGTKSGTNVDAAVLTQDLKQAAVASGQAVAATENTAQQGLSGQTQFDRAVFMAQQKVAQTQGAETVKTSEAQPEEKTETGKTVQPDNVVAFPQQTRLEQLGKTQELSKLADVDSKNLLEQVKTGLAKGVDNGKNDFTIKLKPDGLGEITVRMLETAGKITLSITTANAQTQRLLNNELAALRDAVRPYNVEVQQVESQNTQHFDLGQQRQFTQQQQQSQQQQQQNRMYADYYTAQPEQQAEEPIRQAAGYGSSGLNTVV